MMVSTAWGASIWMAATALVIRQPQASRSEPNVMVPMRDGVRLATDLYRPAESGRSPVILMRTPYGKTAARGVELARLFAERGYLVAIQDVRGKYDSEGRFRIQADDPDDGYDTVEWLARQPWSTGRVGTIGCSYQGEAQIFFAKRRHPAHLAMVPQAAEGPARYLSVINGGAYELALMFRWLRSSGGLVHWRHPGFTGRAGPPVSEGWPRSTGDRLCHRLADLAPGRDEPAGSRPSDRLGGLRHSRTQRPLVAAIQSAHPRRYHRHSTASHQLVV
jgi:hypothetical protein